MICIFAVFRKDILNDHIYGHIKIGPLWIFCIIGHYGPSQHGLKYFLYGCLLEIQQRYWSTAKMVSKNMCLVKSYGQNKFYTQIMTISLVFWPNFWASLYFATPRHVPQNIKRKWILALFLLTVQIHPMKYDLNTFISFNWYFWLSFINYLQLIIILKIIVQVTS